MKNFLKGAALVIGGAAVGVFGKTVYDGKEKEIKKAVKDISKNIKPQPSKKSKKKLETKKEK